MPALSQSYKTYQDKSTGLLYYAQFLLDFVLAKPVYPTMAQFIERLEPDQFESRFEAYTGETYQDIEGVPTCQ
jgi:hypothetical protein